MCTNHTSSASWTQTGSVFWSQCGISEPEAAVHVPQMRPVCTGSQSEGFVVKGCNFLNWSLGKLMMLRASCQAEALKKCTVFLLKKEINKRVMANSILLTNYCWGFYFALHWSPLSARRLRSPSSPRGGTPPHCCAGGGHFIYSCSQLGPCCCLVSFRGSRSA